MEIKVAKHIQVLEWKSFKVWLPDLHSWAMRNLGPEYAGLSSHARLEVAFNEHPGQEVLDKLAVYWDSLTEETEGHKIEHENKIQAAIKFAKDNLIYKTWDQMIPAERKMQQGVGLNLQDYEDLLAKYPQG